jgi:exodeoxyribonuclease V alpha subunit
MNALPQWSGIVQVRNIISSDPLGFGGCIFGGYQVNEGGAQLSDLYLIVKADAKMLSRGSAVSQWEHWQVSGDAEEYITVGDGYARKELRVKADELYMVRQTGETIVKYLSESDKFRGTGVGETKARQLYNRFGEALYEILGNNDIDMLSEVINRESALKLTAIWRANACSRFCSFLQSSRLPFKIAARIIDYYGDEAEAKITADPYRLVSFFVRWSVVDSIAQKTFGLSPDDPRRLKGAIELVLQKQFLTLKHTCLPADDLRRILKAVLAQNGNDTADLLDTALGIGSSNGCFKIRQGGTYHGLGPLLMEQLVASRIAAMIREPEAAPSLLTSNASDNDINGLMASYEAQERRERNDGAFTLNDEQRSAILTSFKHRFSLITGGAGTGKTTTLKCLFNVLRAYGYRTIGLALSGKAVKRLRDATGNDETYTIAKFLIKSEILLSSAEGPVYIVIDEASMLDLTSTFQIFKRLPESARIVFVGDPFQLPPIGPGLIFQQIVGLEHVPQVHLAVVKRQNDTTGIPTFAGEIRNHCWQVPNYPGVKFVECRDAEIKDKVIELLETGDDDTQVLCATKHNISGVEQINIMCQDRLNRAGKPIRLIGPNGNLYATPFRAGDRIIFLKNDYKRGTMNGTTGYIVNAFDEDATTGKEDPMGTASIDDGAVSIYRDDLDLDDIGISLAYAITVHKAQGSQWKRIIVPLVKGQGLSIIDAMWLYTAVTRAEQEVVMLGDVSTFKQAVESPSKAGRRHVQFGNILEDMLKV